MRSYGTARVDGIGGLAATYPAGDCKATLDMGGVTLTCIRAPGHPTVMPHLDYDGGMWLDPAQAADERRLLAAVSRWARRNGWRRGAWSGWHSPDGLVDVWVDRDGLAVRRYDRTPGAGVPRTMVCAVASVREAVDLLVASGVLPVEFSSAYTAGARDERQQAVLSS